MPTSSPYSLVSIISACPTGLIATHCFLHLGRGCLCSLIALGHHPYLLTASCYFTFASTLKPRLAHTVVLTAYGTTRSWTPTAYSLLPGDVGADMDIRKLDSCCRVKALHLRHKPAHLLELQCWQPSWFVPNPSHRSISLTCHSGLLAFGPPAHSTGLHFKRKLFSCCGNSTTCCG